MTKKYDLEERTTKYSENIIDFCKSARENTITRPIISQLIRSATSVGANYCEADCAGTKKDFVHKLYLCKKESKETKYWLRLIGKTLPETRDKAREYWKEANELNLIFSSIINKTKKKEV